MQNKLILSRIKFLLIPALCLGLLSCDEDDEEVLPPPVQPIQSYNATINMTQLVDGSPLVLNTPNKPYVNALNQNYSISRLQYLISDVTFNRVGGGSLTIEGYHYVDVSDSTTLVYTPQTKIPEGDYESVSFTFGFDTTDNVSNAYPDLNILNWNWPSSGMMGDLGGGYHFMRLEGDYDSLGTSKIFRTHMGTARNNTVTPTRFEANHLEITLSNSAFTVDDNFTFDLIMNTDQWYEDTYTWDFNVYNAPIMPIYDAQKRLNENGPTVFSIVHLAK